MQLRLHVIHRVIPQLPSGPASYAEISLGLGAWWLGQNLVFNRWESFSLLLSVLNLRYHRLVSLWIGPSWWAN